MVETWVKELLLHFPSGEVFFLRMFLRSLALSYQSFLLVILDLLHYRVPYRTFFEFHLFVCDRFINEVWDIESLGLELSNCTF